MIKSIWVQIARKMASFLPKTLLKVKCCLPVIMLKVACLSGDVIKKIVYYAAVDLQNSN